MTNWNEISRIAIQVGKNVARSWAGVSPEDCAQEALKAALERPALMADKEDDRGFVYAYMERVATQYASTEVYEYTMRTAQCIYTPAEVRSVLTHYWGGTDEAGTDIHVSLLDVMKALETIPSEDRFRIERRYRDGQDFPTDAARKACDRAVDKLTKVLNMRVAALSETEPVQHFSKVEIRHEAPKAPYQGNTSRPLWDVPPRERLNHISARNRAV